MSSQGSLPSFPSDAGDGAAHPEDHFAPWARRAGGFLVDWILVLVVTSLLARALGVHTVFNVLNGPHHKGARTVRTVSTRLFVATAIAAGVMLVYSVVLLTTSWRATLGMRLCAVELARADDEGVAPVGAAVLRSLVFSVELILFTLLSVLGLLAFLADVMWPLWDPRRQTLHDKLARTVVVRRAPAGD